MHNISYKTNIKMYWLISTREVKGRISGIAYGPFSSKSDPVYRTQFQTRQFNSKLSEYITTAIKIIY